MTETKESIESIVKRTSRSGRALRKKAADKPAPEPVQAEPVRDLNRPEYFFNRELSWLKFNLRVLREAEVKTTPLLERLKFIAISASNLDEFFMVRVAGLWDQLESGVKRRDPSGLTVREQLTEISVAAHDMMRLQSRMLEGLLKELKKAGGPEIRKYSACSEAGREWLENYYREVVYPVLTPMAVDASRPFPFLGNKTLNLAVQLVTAKGEESMSVVQVPSVLPRLIEVVPEEKRTFIYLEDLITEHCDSLFSGCKILDVVPFRITRDSDLDVDEDDIDDLLQEIEKSLRQRKRGVTRRMEIARTMNKKIVTFLEENLDLTKEEVYEINGPLDATCFFGFISLDRMWPWLYEPFVPQKPAELPEYSNIFDKIREKDILFHHPYESFDPIVSFVNQAADDPLVLAIKQTLYRVSGNSPIVAALARAAENGKQVTVLVELKARFDEENNIIWARRLEKAGAHVLYGLVGLKTHSKITLVVRREDDGIRRYVHLATGNYNDTTARIYTDVGLMTCRDDIGEDATSAFNMLSGYSEPRYWNRLALAPLWLKDRFLYLIDREAEHARRGDKARICAKMNSLCDPDIMAALYDASAAGVRIDLIVRGICCLRVGIPGVSDNIHVRSIVGNFLEHSRIFCFENGGRPEVYAASADWMPRNLDRRVEILFPIEDRAIAQKAVHILEVELADTVKAQILKPDGTYERVDKRGKDLVDSQRVFCEEAVKEAQEAARPHGDRVFVPAEAKEVPENTI
jgi:polyphosphate kinase